MCTHAQLAAHEHALDPFLFVCLTCARSSSSWRCILTIVASRCDTHRRTHVHTRTRTHAHTHTHARTRKQAHLHTQKSIHTNHSACIYESACRGMAPILRVVLECVCVCWHLWRVSTLATVCLVSCTSSSSRCEYSCKSLHSRSSCLH